MKTILLSLLFAQVARADDWSKRLESIRDSQTRVKSRLSALGIKDDEPFAQNEKKPQDLLVEFAQTKRLAKPHGSIAYGSLLNDLVVGTEAHPVVIILDESGDEFSGLRVTGTARQAGTPDRVQIEFTRLVLPSGRSVPVQARALDQQGALGIKAEVFSSKALALAGSMAGSFISGLATGYQTQTSSPLGFSVPQSSGRNALLQGLAQTGADQSQRLLEEATREKPVLVIKAGESVSIFFDEELRL